MLKARTMAELEREPALQALRPLVDGLKVVGVDEVGDVTPEMWNYLLARIQYRDPLFRKPFPLDPNAPRC